MRLYDAMRIKMQLNQYMKIGKRFRQKEKSDHLLSPCVAKKGHKSTSQ